MKLLLFVLLTIACSAPPAPWDLGLPNATILTGHAQPVETTELPPPELPPIRVWISPGVTKLDEVRAGVMGWEKSTEGVREWEFVDATPEQVNPDDPVANPSPADVAIYEIGPYGGTCAPESAAGTVAETTALACVWGIGGLWHNDSGTAMPVFLINSGRTADGHATEGYQQNPTLVTMHEIGHLLGLTHQDGVLMKPYSTKIDQQWECPDAETIASLETKLDLSGLKSCAVPE